MKLWSHLNPQRFLSRFEKWLRPGAVSSAGGAADGQLDFSDTDQGGLWALFEDI